MNDYKCKIISVKPSLKHKNYFHVVLESGNKYNIHKEQILNYNIKENLHINENVIHEALNETEIEKIKNIIFLLLSYRSRSKKELKDSLLAKNFKIQNILNVIKDLEKRDYINDLAFTKMYASHLIKEKKLGKYLVEQKLLQHEIDFSVMEPIISELYIKYPVNYLIKEILKKKKWTHKNLLKNKIKIINHLKRKGFNWDDIKPIFNEV